jgi:hypothetical protein
MCEPTALALTVITLSAASTGTSIAMQNRTARTQARAANIATEMGYNNKAIEQQIRNDKHVVDSMERSIAAQQERERIRTAQGESGVLGGITPMREIASTYMGETMDINKLEMNRASGNISNALENQEFYAEGSSKVRAASASMYSPAMALMKFGLDVGGSALNAYSFNQSMKQGTTVTGLTSGSRAGGVWSPSRYKLDGVKTTF